VRKNPCWVIVCVTFLGLCWVIEFVLGGVSGCSRRNWQGGSGHVCRLVRWRSMHERFRFPRTVAVADLGRSGRASGNSPAGPGLRMELGVDFGRLETNVGGDLTAMQVLGDEPLVKATRGADH